MYHKIWVPLGVHLFHMLICMVLLMVCQILLCFDFLDKLNRDKTSLHFIKNIGWVARKTIKEISGLRSIGYLEKYLGLPSMVGRNKTIAFKGIVYIIGVKLNGWKSKFLSQFGK